MMLASLHLTGLVLLAALACALTSAVGMGTAAADVASIVAATAAAGLLVSS